MTSIVPYRLRSRIYITVDETGDIGSDADGRWFILCASAVRDYETFCEATRHFGFVKEMKFRKNRKRREEVLAMADPALAAVYYVAVRKNQRSFNVEEQRAIYRNALKDLSDLVMANETATRVEVEIDENTLIEPRDAEDLFIHNRHSDGRDISAEVVDSYDNYAMQTHDFIAGAIGRAYNRFDDTYSEKITCPKFSLMTNTDFEKRGPESCHCHTDNADTPEQVKDGRSGYLSSGTETEHEEED